MVAPRIVTLGEQAGDNYLVEKGLAEGDRIVTEGVITVRPEMKVEVRPESGQPAQPGQPAPGAKAEAAKAQEEPRS